MSVPEVLHTAADMIEAREEWQQRRDYRRGAGGQTFADLYEGARRRFGEPAIVHLERVLGGQLQHWRETDPAAVIKTLRDAAGLPVDALAGLAAVTALVWDTPPVAALVDAATTAAGR